MAWLLPPLKLGIPCTAAEAIRAYLRQVREAAGQRLIAKCYTAEGGLSKWWAAFGSRRFLGKAMA